MLSLTQSLRVEYKQFRELSRLFFSRFLENDLICLEGDTQASLTGILALLAAPGLFVPFLEFVMFSTWPLSNQAWYMRDLIALSDKVLHLGLSMTILGIVTVLEWDAILPDRRDFTVLRPLPVRLRTLFSAKLASMVKFWALFTLVTSGLSTVLFPMIIAKNVSFDLLVWFIRCHALAVLAGNSFIFLAMIAIQGVMLNVLGWRWYRRVAPFVQSILVALLLVMFFASMGAAFNVGPKAAVVPHAGLRMLPPIWFVGLYDTELGWRLPVLLALARQAWMALGLTALLAAITYALSYQRSVSKSYEESEGPVTVPGWLKRAMLAAVNRVVLRNPAERASFHFVWATIMRSRSHRVMAATYAGAGFALVFQTLIGVIASSKRGLWQSLHGPLLPVQLIIALFVLAGLRYAFTIPAELRANWVLRLGCSDNPGRYMAGARKAVYLLAIVPLFAVMLPLHVLLWGWFIGCMHVLYGMVVASLLMEAMLVGMEKLPFTCSYVPGKANVKASWPLYVMGYLCYVSFFTWVEYQILREPSQFLTFLILAGIAKSGIELYRRRLLADEFALIYDERPEPAVRTLGLEE